jgi:hypothetical protein
MQSQPDTIVLQLDAEETVGNDTVKVAVTVNALVPPGSTDDASRQEWDKILKEFVPSAQWAFSNIQRRNDTGHERINFVATARVDERETFNLQNRAREVSVPGIELTNIQLDSTIPPAKIAETEKNLRAKIIGLAMTELNDINSLTGRDYRLGTIDFVDVEIVNVGMRKHAATMASNYALESVGSAAGGGAALANSQKLVKTARVVFAADPIGKKAKDKTPKG